MSDFSEVIGIDIQLKGADSVTDSLDNLLAKLKAVKDVLDTGLNQDFAKSLESIKSATDEATKKMEKFSETLKKIKNVTDETGEKSKSLSAILKKLGSAFNAIKSSAFVQEIKNGIDASTKYTEVLNFTELSLGEYAQSAIKYADEVNAAYSIDQSNWLSYQSIFANLSSGYGLAADKVALMSQNLTQLGYDIASVEGEASDLEVADVMQKLRSAMTGETKSAKDLGYDLSDARLQLIATTLGIEKQLSAMTQGEKAQLRYYALMTQLTEIQGDFGRTLMTPSNMLKVLKENFTQLSRSIGNIFIPMLQQVLPILIAFVQILKTGADFLAKLLGFKLPDIDYSTVIKTNPIDGINDSLDEASGKAAKLKKQLAGFDEINNLTTPSASSGGGEVSTGGLIDIDLPSYDFLSSSTEFADTLDRIKDTLSIILPIVTGLVAVILTGAVVANFETIKTSITNIGNSITGLFSLFATHPILATLIFIITALATLYATNEDFRNSVNQLFSRISTWWNEKFKPGLTAFTDGVHTIFTNLKSKIDESKTKLGEFKDRVISGIQAIKDKGRTLYDNTVGKIKQIPTAWKTMSQTLTTAIKDGINGKLLKVQNGLNNIVGGINRIVRKINDKLTVKIPDWVPGFGGNKWSPNIKTLDAVSIPMLAKGGVITQEMIATIGEQGKEVVLPLERNTGWMNALATKITGYNDNSTDNLLKQIIALLRDLDLTVDIDGEIIADKTIQRINDRTRLQGKPVIV